MVSKLANFMPPIVIPGLEIGKEVAGPEIFKAEDAEVFAKHPSASAMGRYQDETLFGRNASLRTSAKSSASSAVNAS